LLFIQFIFTYAGALPFARNLLHCTEKYDMKS